MPRIYAPACLSLLLLAATPALAQTRSAEAHFFRPALYSGGIFGVDRAVPTGQWQPSFRFFFNHASTPLKLNFPSGSEEIISSAQGFNLQASLGLTRWLEIAIDVPFARHTLTSNPGDAVEGFERLAAGDPRANMPIPNVSPLDLRLGLKLNLLNRSGFSLAIDLQGTIPFGDEEYFAGDRDFTGHPRLLAGFERGAFAVAANIGYRIRRQTIVLWNDPATSEGPLPLLNFDDELTFALGVAYRLHRVFGLGIEASSAVPITGASTATVEDRRVEIDPTKCPSASVVPCEIVSARQASLPSAAIVELLGGVILTPKPGLDVAVGAGAGVAGAERRAAFRLFAGISWAPGAITTLAARDSDGDGVPDERDRCPQSPEDRDGFQDDDGCPDLDNDGDGIPDGKDRCPTEPEDKDGVKDDDGCPDDDNDGDGIPDAKDSCPNEPEDKDGVKDDDGCPDLDNDGDGIADKLDRCPNEPETPNNYQDEDGCPDSVPGVVIGAKKIEIPETVRFQRGSAKLDPASFKLLDEIAEKIRANPQAGQIRVEGHTDDSGKKAANQKLSQQRAESVREYLIRKGVEAARLQAAGYGMTRPIVANTSAANRAKNRRVEFIIIRPKTQ